MSLLTPIVLLPLLAALVLFAVPREYRFAIRLTALAATLASLVLAIILFVRFDATIAGFQFVQKLSWVPSLGISLHFGVDGLNVGIILMAALVAFAAACVSKEIATGEKDFYILLLMMSGGILGAFASLDLFFFYFFHELALVPTFIMIGVWGHGPRKNYATFQITLYLSLGALLALLGLIALYLHSGAKTFDMVLLTQHIREHPLSVSDQNVIFPLLLFGFGILVSLWPFHTWAPLGYGAAPTATAMLHAGVLKKFGLYGLIRLALPLLPDGAKTWLPLLGLLCLGNILYCGWVAMRQRDLNLLIGNSSVAHMGFVFLGIASLSLIGITGAVVILIAHGLLAALSFALSGALRQQTGTLEISQLGGLLGRLPFLGTALIMAMMAGCGLPGFANFPGEMLVLFGAWKSLPGAVVVGAWGALIVGGVYMLRAIRNILHGPMPTQWPQLLDISNGWRRTPYVLLLAALLLFGVWPPLLISKIEPVTRVLVTLAGGDTGQAQPAAPGLKAQATAATK